MTRDTREMIGAGALVVVGRDQSRCLLCTGASLYSGRLPTYFFCCDLGVHSGLTLHIILIKFISACSCSCHVEIAIRKFNDSLTFLPFSTSYYLPCLSQLNILTLLEITYHS